MSNITKNKANKKDTNDTLSNFVQQTNILVENEINAIAKLHTISPELAQRAMIQWEGNLQHRREIDKEIINLEQREQNIRKKDMELYHRWFGFGIIASYIIPLLIIICGIYATVKGYDLQGLTSLAAGFLFYAFNIFKAFIKKKP